MLLIKHLIAVALLVLTSQGVFASLLMTPNVDPDLVYQGAILEGNYTGDITKPSAFLGFDTGQRVATPAQISAAINAWAGESDRLKLFNT